MATPLYILAGQSNAGAMRASIDAELAARYGAGGYRLISVEASGAPLTYKRSQEDWAASDELRTDLIDQTISALKADPAAQVAGIFWIQGEADSHAIARPEQYSDRLDDLVDSLRAKSAAPFGNRETGLETAPLSLVALSTHTSAAETRSNWDKIVAAQMAYASSDVLATAVNPDFIAALNGLSPAGMFLDGMHYDPLFRPLLAGALIDALSGAGGDGAEANTDFHAGSGGADTMTGGAGNDVFSVNHAQDRIAEAQDQGIDLVLSNLSFSLRANSQHLENLTLTGLEDCAAIGNRQDNTLNGNDAANLLRGGRGNDTLYGNGGDDVLAGGRGENRLVGGTGDDVYRIKATGSRIEEYADEGQDWVHARVSFTLRYHSQDIENLKLTGKADINGTGNGSENLIRGNGGHNRLDGAWGDDTLRGGAGRDELIGHRGDDRLFGGAGGDAFLFAPGHGNDKIEDFQPELDRLGFTGGLSMDSLQVVRSGENTAILYGQAQRLELVDIAPEQLISDNIFFY